MNTNTNQTPEHDNDNDGPNWKWWHFALAGIGISGWCIWRWWETGAIKHLGGLFLAALCLLMAFSMGGKAKTPPQQ